MTLFFLSRSLAGMRPEPVPPGEVTVSLRRRRVLVDLARFFSTVCNPFVMALVLFAILAHAYATDAETFWKWLFLTTFFTAIAPIGLTLWLYTTGKISDIDMSHRAEREKVFGGFVALYILGTIVLYVLQAPMMIVATLAGYTAAAVVVQYITRYWKISTHAMGITAPMVVLVALYGLQPLPFLILIPIVCWSRVYLKKHTVLQVIAGSALGAACVYGFLRLFRSI
jgi:membrane-associated phospholipid phosphatase